MPRRQSVAELRLNDISTCLTVTGNTLQLLADTAKISGLEAILITTQALVKLAERIKQNRNACADLMEQSHQLLNAIVAVYIKSDTGAELPPSVLNHIAKFIQTLHKVHTYVETQQGGNRFATFFRQGELGVLLKNCKAELQQGLDFFQVTNIMTQVKEMQEQAQDSHLEVLNIVETLANSDSTSTISHVYSNSYASSNSISMLPAEPKIFHGRDVELTHILTLFAQGTPRIAILGAGGMGKTSLSRAVLHHSDISTKYGANRFFIACDGSTNKVELAGVIGAHLGLKAGKDLTQGVLQKLTSAPPTLLVLDNLETLHQEKYSRAKLGLIRSPLRKLGKVRLIPQIVLSYPKGGELPTFLNTLSSQIQLNQS
ncbi:hypothetical protein B0H16DRAFT_1423248 [Mycena metata]|uniref:Novel STAND NTPase 1 domain-containing protein n=1 Tax=Mycena metata TaxID=1033252 RepID=A0AAD7N2H5_9AGAR|nr:hypothetical protein B0H16DRAFT_1423248 [Mycena metata]